MKGLVWALVLALAAVAAALAARFNDGNVVVLLPPYRIDLSINAFLVAAVLLLGVVYWIARIVQKIADFPARVRLYRERRAEVGGQRALRDALRSLFEGRFARAERAAKAAQGAPALAGLAALIGARAAHRMQEYERRDDWLAQAEADPQLAMARLVASAEMWTEARENARALDAIAALQSSGGRHIHAARVALAANLQAARWEEVLRGVRLLAKHKALHETVAARYKALAWGALLAQRRHDAAALEAAWNRIPAEDRQIPELALAAARLLNRAGCGRAAGAALEAVLQKHWDERLLDEYASAYDFPARERIEHAEAWLKDHPDDPALLRCLGLLCLREQLWGKARTYLEQSLRAKAHPATLLALGKLAETVGDGQEAARHYREAALGYAQLLAEADASAAIGAPRGGLRETTI
jgi:HemY protein